MIDQETSAHPQASDFSTPETKPSGKSRVAASVALALLEVIRLRDLPTEVLESEDPSQTMPRRLGLSEAVELRIGRYREEARKGRRISDEEARDLFGLVIRRPDSEEVFFQTGEMLAGNGGPVRGLKRLLPGRFRYALARRRIQRGIRSLFDRSIGYFASGSFTLEARGHFLLEMDPGGDACALMTGYAQAVLSRYIPASLQVDHSQCKVQKHDICRWVVTEQGS